jgi:hypothetical protein
MGPTHAQMEDITLSHDIRMWRQLEPPEIFQVYIVIFLKRIMETISMDV